MFVPCVLTTVLKRPEKRYIIFTDQDGMYQLFTELDIQNTIVIKYTNNYCSRNPFVVFRAKRDTINLLKEYKIDSVTFYHTEFGELANYLISKYSKDTPIYFSPPYKKWDIKSSCDLKSIYQKLYIKLFFNTDIIVQLVGEKRYFSMSDKFYIRNRVIRISCEIDNNLINKFVSGKYHFDNSNHPIVLLNGAIEAAGIDVEGYTSIINELINFVGNNNIYTKCHPRYNDLYGMENEITQIPSYIPISLLLDRFDVYIGYWSTSLVEVAMAGKIAISTLFIMPQKQKNRIETEYKVLEDKLGGKGVIYYPKNINELFDLIKK